MSTNPTCKTGFTFVKSRCECKTAKKTAKTAKTKKTARSDNWYQEHWALQPGQYSARTPSKSQLKTRRKRIDKVYEIYEEMKKIDKTFSHPSKWTYPPQYCYNDQLQDVIKHFKIDLKNAKKAKKN
jgi:hypothetical protein